jgi:hypothetical protein
LRICGKVSLRLRPLVSVAKVIERRITFVLEMIENLCKFSIDLGLVFAVVGILVLHVDVISISNIASSSISWLGNDEARLLDNVVSRQVRLLTISLHPECALDQNDDIETLRR